jgi:hypothetical protein
MKANSPDGSGQRMSFLIARLQRSSPRIHVFLISTNSSWIKGEMMYTNRISGFRRITTSGIEVLIVGASIEKLFAAVELHRKGHSVRLIEVKMQETSSALACPYFDRLQKGWPMQPKNTHKFGTRPL